MKRKNKNCFYISVCLITIFVLWTVLVKFIDVKAIGPIGSKVGFATINGLFHEFTGVNMKLYTVTDWLGLVPVGFVVAFAILGFIQWIKRKSILKVDYNILVLGAFYIVVMVIYILFEFVVINYRPVLINGNLEVSYPSSTTMLVMCVMPTAIMQFNDRIKNILIRRTITFAIIVFIAFMVIGRLISGVHWLTDIAGGVILSTGLVMMYRFFINLKN
jgi:undecaprenyl-diphosphatase